VVGLGGQQGATNVLHLSRHHLHQPRTLAAARGHSSQILPRKPVSWKPGVSSCLLQDHTTANFVVHDRALWLRLPSCWPQPASGLRTTEGGKRVAITIGTPSPVDAGTEIGHHVRVLKLRRVRDEMQLE